MSDDEQGKWGDDEPEGLSGTPLLQPMNKTYAVMSLKARADYINNFDVVLAGLGWHHIEGLFMIGELTRQGENLIKALAPFMKNTNNKQER